MPSVPKWKRFETRVARFLGGERVPVTGKGRADRDVETPLLYVQTKFRKAIPDWLFEWMDGICITAKPVGKTGVVVMAQPGMEAGDALVIMRLRDFAGLHGGGQRKTHVEQNEDHGPGCSCIFCRE